MKGRLKLTLLLLLLAGLFFIFRFTPLSYFFEKDHLLGLLNQFKTQWWGPAAYITIYALTCLAALPGLILTLAGGAAFGVWRGTLYTTIAANLGASLAFGAARLLGRETIGSFIKGGKLDFLDAKAAENGFQLILTLRLLPIVPFNALNFGAGLSQVRYRDYALGSFIGMIPGTFIFNYFADALLQGATGAGRKAYLNLALASALLILLSFFPKIYARITRTKG